jgi:hypothetical protein
LLFKTHRISRCSNFEHLKDGRNSLRTTKHYAKILDLKVSQDTISIFLTHSMTELNQLAQCIGLELYEAIDIFSNYNKEII